MVEVTVNIIQIFMLFAAFVIAFRNALHSKKKEWSVAAFFYAIYLMADIYWMLMVYFYHRNPQFYIAEIGWYCGFLFLDILIMMLSDEGELKSRYGILWLVPVFTILMLIFFVYISGDIVNNIAAMLVMTVLMLRSSRGLIYLNRSGPDSSGSESGIGRRPLYALILAICVMEYGMWTISCFWMGDTMRNPYFWFDILISVLMILLIPALGKAVRE